MVNHLTFRSTSEKINDGKQHNFENKTDDEQLLIAARLKPEESDVGIELTDVVENPARGDVADVHYHVDDRERHRSLCDRGVAPRRRQQHWRSEGITNCKRSEYTSQRQP